MNRKYLIPSLRIVNLSSEGMVASSGDDAGGHGPDMPWGSRKNETLWDVEENTSIWR